MADLSLKREARPAFGVTLAFRVSECVQWVDLRLPQSGHKQSVTNFAWCNAPGWLLTLDRRSLNDCCDKEQTVKNIAGSFLLSRTDAAIMIARGQGKMHNRRERLIAPD